MNLYRDVSSASQQIGHILTRNLIAISLGRVIWVTEISKNL